MKKTNKTLISCVALALPMLMIHASPASAEYNYQVVIPPGALSAQTFGINDAGTVVGTADDGVGGFSFTYDMVSGEYTTISTEIGVVEISNSGMMIGSVEDICAIRDKKGNITEFFPPAFGAGSVCSARAVNSRGQVSGFEIDADGIWLGFIYDSKHGTYEEFLPSPQTIAQGINAKGQNVGSVFLIEDDAYPGSPAGRYGYLREKDGVVKYFAISQSVPGRTRGRGISESGLITGFYTDSDTFEGKSYATTLSIGTEFEDVTLTDDQVVYQSPCNPDVPPSPGPGYELVTDMFAQQIRNDGVIVGSCQDTYFDGTTGDFVFHGYGFIATPIK